MGVLATPGFWVSVKDSHSYPVTQKKSYMEEISYSLSTFSFPSSAFTYSRWERGRQWSGVARSASSGVIRTEIQDTAQALSRVGPGSGLALLSLCFFSCMWRQQVVRKCPRAVRYRDPQPLPSVFGAGPNPWRMVKMSPHNGKSSGKVHVCKGCHM